MGYVRVRADDPSVESFRGAFFKIRRALATTAFGINEVRLAPGAPGLKHDEADTGHEEVYIGLAGSGTFTVDGDEVPFTAGDYLRVEPASTRLVVAGPEGLRFVVVGAKPAPAYDGRESL